MTIPFQDSINRLVHLLELDDGLSIQFNVESRQLVLFKTCQHLKTKQSKLNICK